MHSELIEEEHLDKEFNSILKEVLDRYGLANTVGMLVNHLEEDAHRDMDNSSKELAIEILDLTAGILDLEYDKPNNLDEVDSLLYMEKRINRLLTARQ